MHTRVRVCVCIYNMQIHVCARVYSLGIHRHGKIIKKYMGMTEHEFRIVDPSQRRETRE